MPHPAAPGTPSRRPPAPGGAALRPLRAQRRRSASALRSAAPSRVPLTPGALRLLLFASLGALTLIAACGPPGAPPRPDLRASAPQTYYVGAGRGRTMFFRVSVLNRTDSALALHAFAYAANDIASPPARAVYPPRALASMPQDRRFAVGRPALGLPLRIGPGDSAEFRGALPIPAEWSGRPVTADAFRDFSLYLYDARGRTAYEGTWPLRRLRGEGGPGARPF